MIKLFGILDLLVAILFLISIIFSVPTTVLGISGLYLVAKGLIFIGFGFDLLSFFDLISGFIIIFSTSVEFPLFIKIIIAAYLSIKGIVSIYS